LDRPDRQLLKNAVTADALQRDQIATVARFGELRDAAGAADLIKPGRERVAALLGVRLDHADEPMRPQGVVHHGEVARLEDVERHVAARQQEGAGERKNRNDVRAILGAAVGRVHRHGRLRMRHAA